MGWTVGTCIFMTFVIATLLEVVGIFLLWKSTGETQTIRSAYGYASNSLRGSLENNRFKPLAFFAASLAVAARAAFLLTVVVLIWHFATQ
ncbi:hypothetical protein [Roseovarius confluentis]